MAGELVEIERTQTDAEKKDFVLLGTRTIYDLFNEKLAEKGQEFLKKGLPFDEPCARLDFQDKVEKAEKESQRIYGFVQKDLKVDIGDLGKYGDANRFVLIEDQENYMDKVIEGSRTQVISGHTLSYKCKERGHGISVFLSTADYNKRNEVKK
jgi:hypothetical protein